MVQETERQLIECAKKDPQAFGLLYDKYYDRILRYAMYRTGSAEAGRDITSETFFKALKHIGSFRWKGFPFSSWLYRIAGNEIKMYFRKKSYEPVSFEAALETNPLLQIASKQNLEQEVMAAQEAIDRIKSYGPVREAL
ncbi:MAG: sigma-70 family RNA polymerase sigma factor, partial [Spirochaetia bacterium]|nr:sigma-70 family RNA polymerase sigma factor [Spirochaetia bacterium]